MARYAKLPSILPWLVYSCAGCLALSAIIVALVVLQLQTYSRLTYEEPVAELAIERVAAQKYLVRLFAEQQPPQQIELHGDQWQLDARILKWQSWVNALGMHTLYRLERLTSRYQRPQPEQQHSLVALNNDGDTSFAQLTWLPIVDSTYGNSTYMPLGHGARYQITITTSGLVARPINERATQLVKQW